MTKEELMALEIGTMVRSTGNVNCCFRQGDSAEILKKDGEGILFYYLSQNTRARSAYNAYCREQTAVNGEAFEEEAHHSTKEWLWADRVAESLERR